MKRMRIKSKLNRNAIASVDLVDFHQEVGLMGDYVWSEENQGFYYCDPFAPTWIPSQNANGTFFYPEKKKEYHSEEHLKTLLPEFKTIKDNKVVYKPSVIIQFLGGRIEENYYETFEEAQAIYDNLTCDVDIL
jgi:hypothetical protein